MEMQWQLRNNAIAYDNTRIKIHNIMKYLRKFKTKDDYNSFIGSTTDYPNVCLISDEGEVVYNTPPEPLYIEALEDIVISFNNKYAYSRNNITWESATSETIVSASKGEKIYFKANGLAVKDYSGIGRFTISNGRCNVGGHIMSMAEGSYFIGENNMSRHQFAGLFSQASSIISAKNLILPTTLSEWCYYGMFSWCENLIEPPKLEAVTLKSDCYHYMFEFCKSLEVAPELPATTLAYACYYGMFFGCSLKKAPELPVKELKPYCYDSMFTGCDFVTAPELPATTLADFCYAHMFRECENLISGPELPAANLSWGCYEYMFNNCKKLNHIKMLATDISAGYCLDNWVKGVASTGIFIKHPDAELPIGYGGIPENWTVETATV